MMKLGKTDLIDSSQLCYYNLIKLKENVNRSQCNDLAIPNIQVLTDLKACFMSYFHGKTVGKIQKLFKKITVSCATTSKKTINIFMVSELFFLRIFLQVRGLVQ